MTKTDRSIIAILILGLLAALAIMAVPLPALAMDQNAPLGKVIHEATVDDYKLTFRLIDIKEKMKMTKGSEDVDVSKLKSHHLMVMVADAGGAAVTKGKAGYVVTGPDGVTQKAIAMFMNGGFGADVDFKAKGEYQIKAKVMAGDKKLMYGFKYDVN